MYKEKTSSNFGQTIINEAYSETRTWATSFYEVLLKTISKMSKHEARLRVKILTDEIFQKNSTSFVQFKLCQVCSIIKSQQLVSFQKAFHPYENKIKEFLQNESNSALDLAIKSHLKNLIAEKTKIQKNSFRLLSLKMLSNNTLGRTTI
jgi:GR25 family glycosyltransferase involved in LPS biosynthesis